MDRVPPTFSAMTARHPFGSIASAGAKYCPPALLTSTSSRPDRATISDTIRAASAGTRTSPDTAQHPFPMSAVASSRTSGRRPATTTCAPAAASSIDAAFPRPVPPPVTRTTRPASASGAKIAEGTGGSLCRGGNLLQRQHERRDDVGIELRPGARPELLDRLIAGHRPAVGPVARHRVEGVADAHDPRPEGDLVAGQLVGVAASVEVLVRGADQHRHRDEGRGARQDPLADHGVLAHVGPVLLAQRAGLVEDRVRHRHLADVVKLGRADDLVAALAGDPQLARGHGGEGADLGEVLAEVGLALAQDLEQDLGALAARRRAPRALLAVHALVG